MQNNFRKIAHKCMPTTFGYVLNAFNIVFFDSMFSVWEILTFKCMVSIWKISALNCMPNTFRTFAISRITFISILKDKRTSN